MRTDPVLAAYERELTYLREQGREFSRRYSKVAGRLGLDGAEGRDPHIERLIEACAFNVARIQREVDAELPELAVAMVSALQPDLLKPVPSVAIAQLELGPGGGQGAEGLLVPAGTRLTSPSAGGAPCVFRTSGALRLWPLAVHEVSMSVPSLDERPPAGARTVVEVVVRPVGGAALGALSFDSLRLHVHGADSLAFPLYDHLAAGVSHVEVWAGGASGGACRRVGAGALRPAGLTAAEGLLPGSDETPLGRRLLMEAFVFPRKFLFIDVGGLGGACSGSSDELRLRLYSPLPLPPFAREVDAGCLRLGCAPIVNLFERTLEPLRVDPGLDEQRVVPDRFRPGEVEIYQIEAVEGLGSEEGRKTPYLPLLGAAGLGPGGGPRYYARRRPSHRAQGAPSDVSLALVSRGGAPPRDEILRIVASCTQHDLPSRLMAGDGGQGGLRLEVRGLPLPPARCLGAPTHSLPALDAGSLSWGAISALSGDLRASASSPAGLAALREALRAADRLDSPATRQQAEGVVGLTSRPRAMAFHDPEGRGCLVMGQEIEVELDPACFVGSSALLLALILDRVFADAAPINTFTRLTATFSGGALSPYRGPARVGGGILR